MAHLLLCRKICITNLLYSINCHILTILILLECMKELFIKALKTCSFDLGISHGTDCEMPSWRFIES